MGPIAFVIVFMLVPLAAAVFAGAFFASVALVRLLDGVPTAAWAALSVAGSVVLASRLYVVVRGLRSDPG